MRPQPNEAVATVQAYRAGRTARDVESEFGIVDAHRLASNESPFGPLPSVAAAIARATETVNRYPGVRASGLAQRIAERHDVHATNVMVGPGSAGILWQIAGAYLGPGRHMVAPSPSFEGYPLIAQITGAAISQVPLVGHTVEPRSILDAITDATALVVIAEPNNPTGTSAGTDAVAQLIDGTRGRCLLVLDEAYVEFQENPVNSVELALAERHVIVLRTFSKAYGLASLRVGYAIGDADALSFVDRVGPPFSVTAAGEAAAIASLACADELAERVRTVVSERERVIERLRDGGWMCLDSQTNFVFLPVGTEARRIADDLEHMGVVTRPIGGVGLRVTIGTREENNRLLACLASIVRPSAADSDNGNQP